MTEGGPMVDWIQQASRIFVGGHEDRCDAGHGEHDRLNVDVKLGERVLADCPAAPVGLSFWFQVFDADKFSIPAYCTGDDELSRSVTAQGVWEPWETALVTDILATDPDASNDSIVLDLGSHVGWYSTIAAVMGFDVLAVDADREHIDVLAMNAALNQVSERVTAVRGWIDATKPPLPAGQRVRLVKIDVENAERFAVQMLERLLASGDIDYLLIELTPEFGHDWLSAVGDLALAGYDGYRIPTKGDDVDAFERDPLGVTMSRPLTVDTVTSQCSALFCRP